MSLGIKPAPRQTQTAHPELVQSLQLLELSNSELKNFIDLQLKENPFLELLEQQEEEMRSDTSAGNINKPDQGPPGAASYQAADHRNDVRHLEVSNRDLARRPVDDGQSLLGQLQDENQSLFAHLASQIRIHFSDHRHIAFALHIVSFLDEDGFLRRPIANVAADLGTDEQTVLKYLHAIQRCDPVGIAARSLVECFERQLEEQNRLSPAMQVLLGNFDLLAEGKARRLCRLCGVGRNELANMLRELRSLDPRPARRFDKERVPQIIPDVIVAQDAQGNWRIEMNPQSLPRLLVNRAYYAELADSIGSGHDRRFIIDRLASATFLTKSIEQRTTTILKVVTEIVDRQKAFFQNGAEYLQPLSQKDVAQRVSKHESTVCRALANKYVLCNQGVFALNAFFSVPLPSTNGVSSYAAAVVRQKIRQLLAAETAEAVLSDDELADLLRADGVDIARRTVAKYRRLLNIPASSQRRKQLKTNALFN